MNHSKFITRIRLAVVLLGAPAVLSFYSGCLAVAAGAGAAGAVAYVEGDLKATLDAPIDQVVRAANQAIITLEFAKINERQDALQDFITVRTAADKKVEIQIDRVSETVTHVKIRVGVFGDEAVSLRILDRIKASL